MTVKEYMDKAKASFEKMGVTDEAKVARQCDVLAQNMDVWSNAACAGYMLIACEFAEVDTPTKAKLLNALERAFDLFSVDEAIFRNTGINE